MLSSFDCPSPRRSYSPAPGVAGLKPVRASAMALSLTLLAACAVGPNYTAPDVRTLAPPQFTARNAVTADAPTDHWWLALHDPTLNTLIERALADNPDLAAAEARVQQARALARITGAEFYPSVNAEARVSRDKLSKNGENLALIPFPVPTTEFTDYRLGFDASWEIDLAGKTRRDVEAAVARWGSQVETQHDARLVIAADVATAYVDYRANGLRLDLARHTLSAFDDVLRLVTLQVNAGLASERDRQRAEADRLAAAALLPTLEAERQSALFQLAALGAAGGAGAVSVVAESLATESLAGELATPRPLPEIPATAAVGIPADLLQRRPDVRQAERELAAATAAVGSAVAAQFPRFSLVGDLGWDAVRPGDLTRAASRYWNLTPQLTVPLLAGGRLRAQVEESKAARDAALGTYHGTVLRALADTETCIIRYAGERQREAALAEAEAALAVDLTLARKRHAAGDASLIDVLTAERARDQAADQHVASRAQLALDYVALGKALGGGWQ